MDELIEAGLVATCGRPVVIQLCYVPATGYTPYKNEVFADEAHDAREKQALNDLAEVRQGIEKRHLTYDQVTALSEKMRKALDVLEGLR